MGQMLIVDLGPRDIRHETTEDLEVQCVPFRLAASEFGLSCGDGLGSGRMFLRTAAGFGEPFAFYFDGD